VNQGEFPTLTDQGEQRAPGERSDLTAEAVDQWRPFSPHQHILWSRPVKRWSSRCPAHLQSHAHVAMPCAVSRPNKSHPQFCRLPDRRRGPFQNNLPSHPRPISELMVRVSRHPWTAEEIDLLYSLIESGASPARASVVLKRPMLAVRSKARAVGRPFPDSRQIPATRLGKEASELNAIEPRKRQRKAGEATSY